MKKLDTNQTGQLEFEEFATFILYDPYKWWERKQID
jgi:Ca2+-binding EF-hand superfamily protein